MKNETVKIYGIKYKVFKNYEKEPDLYYYRNELSDEPLEDIALYGYVQMEDGSVVGIYKQRKTIILIILGSLAGVALITAAALLIFNIKYKPEVTGTYVKINSSGSNVIAFNGIASYDGESVFIQFSNGDVDSTISIEGEGITSQPVTVKKNTSIDSIPISYTSSKRVVEAMLKVESKGKIFNYPIVVEARDDAHQFETIEGYPGVSPEDHPFDNEEIFPYGNQPKSAEPDTSNTN